MLRHPPVLRSRRSARHDPPLLQIGPPHKVACHFAGELGHHPAQPVTAPLYAEGPPSEQADRLVEVSTDIEFGPRWLDLPSGEVVAEGRKVAGGGSGRGDDLPGQS